MYVTCLSDVGGVVAAISNESNCGCERCLLDAVGELRAAFVELGLSLELVELVVWYEIAGPVALL